MAKEVSDVSLALRVEVVTVMVGADGAGVDIR